MPIIELLTMLSVIIAIPVYLIIGRVLYWHGRYYWNIDNWDCLEWTVLWPIMLLDGWIKKFASGRKQD